MALSQFFGPAETRLIYPPYSPMDQSTLSRKKQPIILIPGVNEGDTVLAHVQDDRYTKIGFTGSLGVNTPAWLSIFSLVSSSHKIRVFDRSTGGLLTHPIPVTFSSPLFTKGPYYIGEQELDPAFFETDQFPSTQPFGMFRAVILHFAGGNFAIKGGPEGLIVNLKKPNKKEDAVEHLVYNPELPGFMPADEASTEKLLGLQHMLARKTTISAPQLDAQRNNLRLPKKIGELSGYASDGSLRAMSDAYAAIKEFGGIEKEKIKTKVTAAFFALTSDLKMFVERDMQHSILASALADIMSRPDIAFGEMLGVEMGLEARKQIILRLTQKYENLFKANQPLLRFMRDESVAELRKERQDGLFDPNDVLLRLLDKIESFGGDVNLIRDYYGHPRLEMGVGVKNKKRAVAIKFNRGSIDFARYLIESSYGQDTPEAAKFTTIAAAMLVSCEVADETRAQDEIRAIVQGIIDGNAVSVEAGEPSFANWMSYEEGGED